MRKRKNTENKSRLIHIRLSEELHRRLRIHVAELDTKMQYWVEELIENELNKQDKKGEEK